jgi:quercetin dioxygenase-like cupin family protein
MPDLAVVLSADAGAPDNYPPASWTLAPQDRARRLSPPGVSLWLHDVTLSAGSQLCWDSRHGDEVLYVLSGSIALPGSAARVVPTGGALIVEAGVAYEVTVAEPTRILHMGPADPAPPSDGPYGAPLSEGHGVHAVGPGGVYARSEVGRDTRFFADSSCPTCRLTLMKTGRDELYVSEAHSHSQDELIHVLTGEITVGRQTLGPGDTLFVAADRRYTFTGGTDGFSFLNYRRDASLHTPVRGGSSVLEGGATHGFAHVGDLV